MRNYPNFNFQAFYDAARDIRDNSDIEVVSPAEIDEAEGLVRTSKRAEKRGNGYYHRYLSVDLTPKFTIERALRRDFEEILKCDAVILLPGWETSAGANAERNLANQVGLEVYEYVPLGEGALREIPADFAPPLRLVEDRTEDDPEDPEAVYEERITDPATGGQKGRKLARMDLIPWDAVYALSEHYGAGASKYEDRNWERGYDWSLSFGAMQRHAALWWQGEDVDPEGYYHLRAVAWHALNLLAFSLRGAGTDDRPVYGGSDDAA